MPFSLSTEEAVKSEITINQRVNSNSLPDINQDHPNTSSRRIVLVPRCEWIRFAAVRQKRNSPTTQRPARPKRFRDRFVRRHCDWQKPDDSRPLLGVVMALLGPAGERVQSRRTFLASVWR